MHDASRIESDVAEELCALLQIFPREVRPRSMAVLTTTPALWASVGAEAHVVDLSSLFSPRNATDASVGGSLLTDLLERILVSEPDAVIVDFTVPAGVPIPAASSPGGPAFSPPGLSPDDLPELVGRHVDVYHLLLAWAASIPSVQAISTVAPSSVTTDPEDDWLRQHLSERLSLCAVVELPVDILRPLTAAATSVLYFGGTRTNVYFDSLTSRGDLIDVGSRPWFRSLMAWMQGPGALEMSTSQADGTAQTVIREAQASYSEAPTSLDADETALAAEPEMAASIPEDATTGHVIDRDTEGAWVAGPTAAEIAEIEVRIGRFGVTAKLGDLCSILVGRARPRAVEDVQEGVILVEPRDLRDGIVDIDGASRVQDRDIADDERLHTGDILISLNVAGRFTVALNGYGGPAILSDAVAALRPSSNLVSPEYIFEFLSSSIARKLLEAKALGGRLQTDALHVLPIPVVQTDRLQGIGAVQRVERALRAKADELQADRRALFDAKNKREFGGRLDGLQRRGKLLSISLQSLESLDYQIAVTYPFPIAYGYRLLQSSTDPAALGREQFRLAENMLAFLGCISLALLEPGDREDIAIDPSGPMTLGKWREVIVGASERFSTYQDNPLATALARLNIKVKQSGFGGAIEEIVKERNAWAHMKDSSLPEDMEQENGERQDLLRSCMQALDFLTEYPIRRVQTVNRLRSGEWKFECLCYRGDHPGLPQEEVRIHGGVPEGDLVRDLFLDTGQGPWLSLYPFISSWNCAACKWRETYYIDSWKARDGAVELKSFERGHLMSRPQMSASLEP